MVYEKRHRRNKFRNKASKDSLDKPPAHDKSRSYYFTLASNISNQNSSLMRENFGPMIFNIMSYINKHVETLRQSHLEPPSNTMKYWHNKHSK